MRKNTALPEPSPVFHCTGKRVRRYCKYLRQRSRLADSSVPLHPDILYWYTHPHTGMQGLGTFRIFKDLSPDIQSLFILPFPAETVSKSIKSIRILGIDRQRTAKVSLGTFKIGNTPAQFADDGQNVKLIFIETQNPFISLNRFFIFS